jgi:isopentenyldiphosphate isomerase
MTEQEEIFDIYNAQMERIGTTGRSEVHAKGYWHQTFHCWIVDQSMNPPSLLLQLRHPDKDTFPGLLDVSCAGHLSAGESVMDGVRELEEELGVQVAFSSLIPCGIYAEEDALPDQRMDREFSHIFIYSSDQPLLRYQIQADELTGLFWARLDEFEALIDGAISAMLVSGGILSASGELMETRRNIRMEDLVPHDKEYFELVFDAVNQMQSKSEHIQS